MEPCRRVQVRPDHLPAAGASATAVYDTGRGRGGRGPPAAVVAAAAAAAAAAASSQEVVAVLDCGL